MSICWYCYWGWPRPVADIYQDALNALRNDHTPLHFGPAHVVWEDENFDTAAIASCLASFEQCQWDYTETELAIIRTSLLAMAALPSAVRDMCPDDYDGEHPEQFPPPVGGMMVRIC